MNNPATSRHAFDFSYGTCSQATASPPGTASHFLLIADFSGRAHRGIREPLASRKLSGADVDTLGDVLARNPAALRLPVQTESAETILVRLECIDDFEPDALLQQLPPLRRLLAARQALDSPEKSPAVIQELPSLLGTAASPPLTAAAAPPITTDAESTEATLTRLLGGPPASVPPASKAAPGIQAFIESVVASSTNATPAAPAALAGWRSAVDLELAARLRNVLHHPGFQAVEAARRSADFLVRRCPDEARSNYPCWMPRSRK